MLTLEPPFNDQFREALCRLLEDVPDAEVLRFAKTDQTLLTGARAVMAGVPVIRRNIRKVLRSRADLGPAYRDFLASNSLHQRLVTVLSVHALEVGVDALAIHFHGSHLLAALMLDDRPEVQKLGVARITAGALDKPAPTDEERAEAAERLAHDFRYFLEEVGGLLAAAGEDAEHIPAELIAAA